MSQREERYYFTSDAQYTKINVNVEKNASCLVQNLVMDRARVKLSVEGCQCLNLSWTGEEANNRVFLFSASID